MLSRRDSSGGPELLGVFGKIDASYRQLKEGRFARWTEILMKEEC
ncbi:hypothetical protein FOQG_11720 [Fusarium oxysporum f. sp. raphani 54005]|uniref:Uncharacterized protein n=2 Tax=Fusarium oxysporum TaxID=5507 RepID=X0BQ37_FUSOX|nr:hypothetical protein FOVG_12618 [Fusarium oxysporum f. sp. pisi HDV247]EXK83991.1 hypothetical protein FOQG_11720 [Fusarium oxysporum f. sp. raphani 54005]